MSADERTEATRPGERPVPMRLLGAALWRRLDVLAFEHFRLQEFAEGFVLDGRVLTTFDGQPAEAHYMVLCGRDWHTRHVRVALTRGVASSRIELRRDDGNRWWRGSERIPELDGLIDIDLAITPATNTIPIRRLALAVGDSAASPAAWLRFPELTLEPLPQRYMRLAPHRYRYESGDGEFGAELHIDEVGIVTRYGDMWERVAP